MHDYLLFTDASVNNSSNNGVGGFLMIEAERLIGINAGSLKHLNESIVLQRFKETSSTKLELQTLLWALTEINPYICDREYQLTVYTDSQNIISLPNRRTRIEANDYLSRTNKRLNNQVLYQRFYAAIDSHPFTLIKVKGHQSQKSKTSVDIVFSLVDKATRLAQRNDTKCDLS
jgi:ribonuclease HI